MNFFGYKKCSTCREAYKYLTDHGISIAYHDFVVDPPSEAEIQAWVKLRGEGVAPFVNVKGTSYREQGLKDKDLSDEDLIRQMSRDGKLIKRPILVLGNRVVIGFNKDQYADVVRQRS